MASQPNPMPPESRIHLLCRPTTRLYPMVKIPTARRAVEQPLLSVLRTTAIDLIIWRFFTFYRAHFDPSVRNKTYGWGPRAVRHLNKLRNGDLKRVNWVNVIKELEKEAYFVHTLEKIGLTCFIPAHSVSSQLRRASRKKDVPCSVLRDAVVLLGLTEEDSYPKWSLDALMASGHEEMAARILWQDMVAVGKKSLHLGFMKRQIQEALNQCKERYFGQLEMGLNGKIIWKLSAMEVSHRYAKDVLLLGKRVVPSPSKTEAPRRLSARLDLASLSPRSRKRRQPVTTEKDILKKMTEAAQENGHCRRDSNNSTSSQSSVGRSIYEYHPGQELGLDLQEIHYDSTSHFGADGSVYKTEDLQRDVCPVIDAPVPCEQKPIDDVCGSHHRNIIVTNRRPESILELGLEQQQHPLNHSKPHLTKYDPTICPWVFQTGSLSRTSVDETNTQKHEKNLDEKRPQSRELEDKSNREESRLEEDVESSS